MQPSTWCHQSSRDLSPPGKVSTPEADTVTLVTDTSQTHCDLARLREDEIRGRQNWSDFTGLENQSLGQPGETDNEVLIGKAKTGFPGRAIAMRWGKKPSATEQDLTVRGGTRVMVKLKGWRWESGEKQATLPNPPSSLGCNHRCLGSSGSMAAY